jgi:hypothetical protein
VGTYQFIIALVGIAANAFALWMHSQNPNAHPEVTQADVDAQQHMDGLK